MKRQSPVTMFWTATILTSICLFTTNSLPVGHTDYENIDSQTKPTPYTAEQANSSDIRLTNSKALQLLLAAYLTGRINPINITTSPASPVSRQQALLDYEDENEIEVLEKQTGNLSEVGTELELPPDVYEVSLEVWMRKEEKATPPTTNTEDEAELIISELLRTQATEPGAHTIRHRSRRLVNHNSHRNQRPATNSQTPTIPSTSTEDNILDLLRQYNSSNEIEASKPLDILLARPSFNMTVNYEETFENIESNKLLEIVQIMRSDCTKMTSQKKMINWVSESRGILFECQNGAWVVTYLSKPIRKPKPISVTDCHDLHLQELHGTANTLPKKLVIYYSDGERKKKTVICKHSDQHTNHQLVDNSINPDPNWPVTPIKQTVAGAWTVIQRRANGNTKFYRSMRRYKRGFGSIESGEYWLGLEALHEITHTREYMLRIQVTTGDNLTYTSDYAKFRVGSEAKNYRLRLGAFVEPTNGTLSSGDFLTLHHGGKFHTRDSDQFSVNCAKLYGTAFWFRGCWAAINLNGPYVTNEEDNMGVRWATDNPNEIRRVWKTEMMIKPVL